MKIINFDFLDNYRENLITVIENADYSEIITYLDLLPKLYESEESLYDYGISYINRLYKEIVSLDNLKNNLLNLGQLNDEERKKLNEIENKEQFVYVVYTLVNYKNVCLNFKQFLTFSKLLVTAFSDYNPNLIREQDNHPFYHPDKSIEYVVNAISYKNRHSEHEGAFEIDRTKLEILINTLENRANELQRENFKKSYFEDSSNYLEKILSSSMAKEKVKRYVKDINNR